MKQPKLHYMMNNSHHYFIWRITEKEYWIYDLCTTRYTDERWATLDEAINECWKKYWAVLEFNTYIDLFEYMSSLEAWYNIIDLFWDKNLIERESLHNGKVWEIQKKMWME